MDNTSDTYNEAMGIITAALANWSGGEEASLQYTRDAMSLCAGKTPQELMIMIMALGQTAVGFLQLAAERENMSPEELLRDIALNVASQTEQDEK